MPNHFHFLIEANDESCMKVEESSNLGLQILSKNFGSLLSSYSQAINKQKMRKGKLFSHNTKAKCLNEIEFDNVLSTGLKMNRIDYATVSFHYIHQNPVMSGLVTKMEDWEFSSYRDFSGLRKGTLINKELASGYIDTDFEIFNTQSQFILDENILRKLF